MLGRLPKNCRRPPEKLSTPMVFRTEGAYTRHRWYTAKGGAQALSRGFAPGTQTRATVLPFTGPGWGVLEGIV